MKRKNIGAILALGCIFLVGFLLGIYTQKEVPEQAEQAEQAVLDPESVVIIDLDKFLRKAPTPAEIAELVRQHREFKVIPAVTVVPNAPENEQRCPEPSSQIYCKVASNYGHNDGFHGEIASNGQVYNQWSMVCAHKYYPYGTMLELHNPEKGYSCWVEVVDRGPYHAGRQIDLSTLAAKVLGVEKQGVAPILMRIVRRGAPMYFTVQLRASDSVGADFQRLGERLSQKVSFPLYVEKYLPRGATTFKHRLVAGRFAQKKQAERARRQLRRADRRCRGALICECQSGTTEVIQIFGYRLAEK